MDQLKNKVSNVPCEQHNHSFVVALWEGWFLHVSYF